MKLTKKQLQKLKELGYQNDYLDKNKFIKEITYNQRYALCFYDDEYAMKYAIETTGYTSIISDLDIIRIEKLFKKVQEDYRTIISIED